MLPFAARLRPGEVATCLAGLYCAPRLPLAWLQWGTALLLWAKEASRPGGVSGAGPGGGGTAGGAVATEHLEASSAGVHALCRYLGLAASQMEIARPEDAMPCLVRILQVERCPFCSHGLLCACVVCEVGVWPSSLVETDHVGLKVLTSINVAFHRNHAMALFCAATTPLLAACIA